MKYEIYIKGLFDEMKKFSPIIEAFEKGSLRFEVHAHSGKIVKIELEASRLFSN